ncbi:MAG: PQQ-dependent sugar dehydrogenase [Bryobacterales bacterium]|nr:PQQ-dependent sugar dehydrogenase [Bryobacterales bacterium]
MGLWLLVNIALRLALAQEIRLTAVAPGIDAPTDIQHAGDGSGRLFLVQQNGLIRVLRNGALEPQPFLDIRAKTRAAGERGLLGLAFAPGFGQNGRYYVNYTNIAGTTVIAMYRAGSADETVLLEIAQPFSNHNGGQLRFGPDEYLYIGMGDGGSAGDPQNHGQNRNSLLGKMLRLDVESDPGRVRIPADNPFVNTSGTRPEIWALGLRNPWRFSFDRATGDLWIGDVGQNLYEEIDFQPASSRGGENYGWNQMEGAHCFRPNCSTQGMTLPVAEYGRGDGCSVTGGFVYRGRNAPGLRGSYVYADYCSGKVWGLERSGTQWVNRLLMTADAGITTFGEDEAGELFVGNAGTDTIYRIEGSAAPRFSAAGVVNSASFAPGMVPGALATIFASGLLDEEAVVPAPSLPLPVELAGLSLTVNGTAAGILGVARQRALELVHVHVPAGLTGESAAVAITRNGNRGMPVSVPILSRQPAVFTSNGTDAIVVRVPEYALVTASQPLRRGEFVFLYANALGAESTTRLTIGGVNCAVQFAGPAPGLTGIHQVNFQVAEETPRGAQDLILSVAAVSSPAVRVTVE